MQAIYFSLCAAYVETPPQRTAPHRTAPYRSVPRRFCTHHPSPMFSTRTPNYDPRPRHLSFMHGRRLRALLPTFGPHTQSFRSAP